jgi:rRNA maturation RNase YbeY
VSLSFQNQLISFLPKNRNHLKSWIRNIISGEGKNDGDITFIFTNDNNLLDINLKYLEHDYFTDIISFDYSEGFSVSGDIFISLDRVRENSENLKTDLNEELKRVIIHGILHLCGYKDKTSEERVVMTNKENSSLQIVKDLLIV